MRWTDRFVGFVSTLILARILVPADFGIVAMCSLVIGLVDVLLDLGVGTVLIRHRAATPSHYHTAWTLRFAQTTLGAVIVFSAAPIAATYFGDARLTVVLRVMSAGLLLAGLENIGIVDFQKKMHFGLDFRFAFFKRIVGFAVTIAAAYAFRSYWALVAGALTGRAFGVVLSYVMHPLRPKFSLAQFRDIFAVSQWMVVRSTGLYLDNCLHRLLVGGRDNASVMGGYTLANEVSSMPTTELLAPLNRVLFPTFVRASHDPSELRRLFLLAQGVQTLIAVPAAVGLAMVAHDAVPLLLGEKWRFAIPFVQILALASVVQAITTSGGYVLITLGRIRQSATLIWIQVALFATIAWGAIPFGHALQLAEARLAAVVVGLGLAVWFLRDALPNVSLGDIARSTMRPLLAAGTMAVALSIFDRASTLTSVARLGTAVVLGATTFFTVVVLVWRMQGKPDGAESYMLDAASRWLHRNAQG
jgi:O-antigen/teichoic acid export membrane protein